MKLYNLFFSKASVGTNMLEAKTHGQRRESRGSDARLVLFCDFMGWKMSNNASIFCKYIAKS